MKYKLILLLLLSFCITQASRAKSNFSFSSKGFAFIIKDGPSNLKGKNFSIFHSKLKKGTKIRITNPHNKKFLEAVVKKKIKYDSFYKISISANIAQELLLDLDFPYVEINEIRSNKSFVSKKAITENVEKIIPNKAPIDKIEINNISKQKKKKSTKVNTYSILVAEFYYLESAELLKEKLILILKDSNYQLMYIKEKNKKSYELLMGPYNTINKLKNDYIVLDESNFEDLDIKIND